MKKLDASACYPLLPESFTHALADEPIVIDGMRVEFDVKAALAPVTFTPSANAKARNGGSNGALR